MKAIGLGKYVKKINNSKDGRTNYFLGMYNQPIKGKV